ncbi:hypothetical protein M0Q28_04345 [Patescibacteria group bacterium]|jgi:hypothetical protein|nr:hypothetical protein [Patescibacteria group bacterium]
MAKIVRLDSIEALYNYDVEEPASGTSVHATLIVESFMPDTPVEGEDVLRDDEDVTVVSYVSYRGGKGGISIDLVDLIREPLVWAYSLVLVVGTSVMSGFTNAAGDDLYRLFKGGLQKFMAKRSSPGQICITSEHGAQLEVIVPDMVTEEEIEGLDRLINEKLRSMPKHGYSKMFFSPKRMELTRIYES